uniref:Uncharacterized protein n=1 Tax=Anguilla anguilla TaxID=7936 RepID=A0A0E9XFH9_ANGAN
MEKQEVANGEAGSCKWGSRKLQMGKQEVINKESRSSKHVHLDSKTM